MSELTAVAGTADEWAGDRPPVWYASLDGGFYPAGACPQCDVIGSPIRHSVPLLRDVITAILVRFEWHGGCPGSETGPCYTVQSSPPND